MENGSTGNKVLSVVKTIVFFALFTPYILIITAGIRGINFGFGQGFGRFFGLDGAFLAAFMLLITGIIPVCLVFQISIGVKFIRKNKVLKLIALASIICLVILLICVKPISDYKQNKILSTEPERITEYLADKYGREMASDISVEFDHEDQGLFRFYKVSTPVLPEGNTFTVRVHIYKDNKITDELMGVFREANPDFNDRCNTYVCSKYNIPASYELVGYAESVDFKNYRHGDDCSVLIDRTDFIVQRININTQNPDTDSIKNTLDGIWNNALLKHSIYSAENAFVVKINQNGFDKYTAYIYPRPELEKAKVSVYTNSGHELVLEYELQ